MGVCVYEYMRVCVVGPLGHVEKYAPPNPAYTRKRIDAYTKKY